MKNKNRVIIFIIILSLMVFSPVSLSNTYCCKCGGCCEDCPGDCNSLGAPLPYYYWGDTNTLNSEEESKQFISEIYFFGLFIDIALLLSLIYALIYKRN